MGQSDAMLLLSSCTFSGKSLKEVMPHVEPSDTDVEPNDSDVIDLYIAVLSVPGLRSYLVISPNYFSECELDYVRLNCNLQSVSVAC